MLRPKNLTDLYYWLLVYNDGRAYDQLGNNRLPKYRRLDINGLPESAYGRRPFVIMLIPRRSHLPLLHWRIPEGCRPFYAGANIMHASNRSRPIGFKYLIGYAEGQHRVYYAVDPETGAVEQKEDHDG